MLFQKLDQETGSKIKRYIFTVDNNKKKKKREKNLHLESHSHIIKKLIIVSCSNLELFENT